MQLELIRDGDGAQSITIYIPSRDFAKSARDDHPNFKTIKRTAFEYDAIQDEQPLTIEQEQSLIDLFDIADAIDRRFARLDSRYTVRKGMLCKDNDPLPEDDPWVQQVMSFVIAGEEDYRPLIAFRDKLDANPNEHSREQFFNFLSQYPITITDEGDVVLYKGVNIRHAESESYEELARYAYESCSGGPDTIVDDEEQPDGKIKQGIGSVVEHPRSLVHFDPSRACSNGLHCGTYQYASGYGNKVLRVIVNPRDVINVPNHDHKVRVCRYEVDDVAENGAYSEALLIRDYGTQTSVPTEAPYVPPKATYDVDEGQDPVDYGLALIDELAEEPVYAECGEYEDDCECCVTCECVECSCEDDKEEDGELVVASPWSPEPSLSAPKPPRKRYPSPARWEEIQIERKARKKGIATLAAREGWILDSGIDEELPDPQERKSWLIAPKA